MMADNQAISAHALRLPDGGFGSGTCPPENWRPERRL